MDFFCWILQEFSTFMHVLRSLKFFEKYEIMQKLLSVPVTPPQQPCVAGHHPPWT